MSTILTDPASYCRMISDDAPAAPAELQIPDVPGIEYVAVKRGTECVGVFVLLAQQQGAEVHFCFLPKIWGCSQIAGKAFIQWAWTHTVHKRLVGPVPAYNRLALHLAEKCGFERCGVVKNAGRKHGNPFDLILLSIERESYP